jgi:2,3-diketo-5-methylthio-1-phosphopentane phosphatase
VNSFAVFCDFDGTVAQNDVGNLVFEAFGDPRQWQDLVEEWKAGRCEARELWRRQAAITRMSKPELEAFAARQPLDPYFESFVEFCYRNQLPIAVVSDGMDAYIHRILAAHGLGDLPVYCNHLTLYDDHSVSVSFPYYEEGCGQCANCKGFHLQHAKENQHTTIYVGDGYSDLCAVPEADILFAKDDLAEYCQRHNLAFRSYRHFGDVQNAIDDMIS